MTKEQAIAIINTRVKNSAVDAFTNASLNSVLLYLVSGGITTAYNTVEEFQAAIAATPDTIMMAFIAQDNVYTGDEDVVLINVPGQGVGQVAVDFFT